MLAITFLLCAMIRLPLCGISKSKFKKTRTKFSLSSLVQIHHIIPREFRNHPVLYGFDIEDGQNFMFMPNDLGKVVLLTGRPNHNGGHHAYNRYVGSMLDFIEEESSEDRIFKVQELTFFLRNEIRSGCENIPWK